MIEPGTLSAALSLAVLIVAAVTAGMVLQMGGGAKAPTGPASFMAAQDRIGVVPYVFTSRFAGGSIATINLPQITAGGKGVPWYLVKVSMVGGAGSGSFNLKPNGQWTACFPVTNAGFMSYDVNWLCSSTSIPSGNQTTFGTAPAQINLTFSSVPWNGIDIRTFASIFITDTEGGANASLKALSAATYDVTPAIPVGYLCMITAGNGLVAPPANPIQQEVECQLDTITYVQAAVEPAALQNSAASIVVSIINSAAATLHIWVFYQPTTSVLQA